MDFKTACCSKFGWEEENFHRHLFFRTVPPIACPIVALLGRFRPAMFEVDLSILREFSELENRSQFRSNAHQIPAYYQELRAFNFWRKWTKIRISGRRLIQLADAAWGSPR